ncbi:hypothetical protein N7468_003355 [Penicillium chermesinum]|uniref:Small ribosomal subunit protein uS15 N-terminal domain-containing protein n=1 Tax=Penicillium chermesinum TaxID=63820 RepID=A0A9W9P6Z1_9EURO|nr:uncharacterized protein N7468_003355 [Penicillium chermesinum]KAJ5238736.1 hypothetical protein N7468_003355 [Penicillium chermesinum]
MGRLHSKGKGIASSAIPYSRTPPAWLKTTPEQVVEHITKLAKKGATPSQIGVVLRDSHGIAQVKFVTGLAPELPEDLYFLIKKAVAVRKHLERNRKDKDSKFRLIPDRVPYPPSVPLLQDRRCPPPPPGVTRAPLPPPLSHKRVMVLVCGV